MAVKKWWMRCRREKTERRRYSVICKLPDVIFNIQQAIFNIQVENSLISKLIMYKDDDTHRRLN